MRTPVELRGEGLTTVGDFVVSAGQRVPLVLTCAPSHLPLPEPIDVDGEDQPRVDELTRPQQMLLVGKFGPQPDRTGGLDDLVVDEVKFALIAVLTID
jgi:hypothetical protein